MSVPVLAALLCRMQKPLALVLYSISSVSLVGDSQPASPANQPRQPRRGAAALEVWIGLSSPAQCCACLQDKGYCKLKQRGSSPPPATPARPSQRVESHVVRLLCSQSLALLVANGGPNPVCPPRIVPRSATRFSSVSLSMLASAMSGHPEG